MTAAAVVTIVAVVLVVLVIVGFLLAIARVLVGVDKTLGTVIEAVGAIAAKTEPVAYVVDSLNSNLGQASGTLTSLLESKVGAAGAEELVASVDPIAAARRAEPEPARIRYEREDPVAAEEPGPEPARIRYEREDPVAAEEPGPEPARIRYEREDPVAAEEPEPDRSRIHYEHESPHAEIEESEGEPVPEPPERPFPGAGGDIRLGGRPTT